MSSSTNFFTTLVYFLCIASTIVAYFQITEKWNVSLHLIAIPIYIWTLVQLWGIVAKLGTIATERNISIFFTLFSGCGVNMIYNLLIGVGYGLTIPFIVEQIDNYRNYDNMEYYITGVMYFIGVHNIFQFIHYSVGNFCEVYYFNGTIHAESDPSSVGDEVAEHNKPFKVYLFEVADKPIVIRLNWLFCNRRINYSTFWNIRSLIVAYVMFTMAHAVESNDIQEIINVASHGRYCIIIGTVIVFVADIILAFCFANIFGNIFVGTIDLILSMIIGKHIMLSVIYILGAQFMVKMYQYIGGIHGNDSINPTFLFYATGIFVTFAIAHYIMHSLIKSFIPKNPEKIVKNIVNAVEKIVEDGVNDVLIDIPLR